MGSVPLPVFTATCTLDATAVREVKKNMKYERCHSPSTLKLSHVAHHRLSRPEPPWHTSGTKPSSTYHPRPKKTPPNPPLGYNGDSTAPPSTLTTTSSATRSTLAHRVLLYDQRCLVTGAVSTQLRPYHLVKAIHINKNNPEEKLTQKEEVVAQSIILDILGGSRIFSFRNASSPDNSLGLGTFPWTAYRTVLQVSEFPPSQRYRSKYLSECPVDAQWHSHLDTHGTFCIIVPLPQILAIITKLAACNHEWTRRAKLDPGAPRNLEVCEARGPLHIPKPHVHPDNRGTIHCREMCPSRTSPQPFSSGKPPSDNQHPPCTPRAWWTLPFRLREPFVDSVPSQRRPHVSHRLIRSRVHRV